MHESCLLQDWQRQKPHMTCISTLQASLEKDALRQAAKYRGAAPSSNNARFHVDLPGPQASMKLMSRPRTSSGLGQRGPPSIDELDSPLSARPASTQFSYEGGSPKSLRSGEGGGQFSLKRFNVATLREWFCDIDSDSSGSISQRELIVALRQHKGMQALFSNICGIDVSAFGGMSIPGQSMQARREEVGRIKRILDDIDTDGSGTMEWDEFVEFFRRTGLFLEYQTRSSLNDWTALMSPQELEHIAMQKTQTEKEEEQRKTPRRCMTVSPTQMGLALDEDSGEYDAASED